MNGNYIYSYSTIYGTGNYTWYLSNFYYMYSGWNKTGPYSYYGYTPCLYAASPIVYAHGEFPWNSDMNLKELDKN